MTDTQKPKTPRGTLSPAWCSVHQHRKWCEHNGGVLTDKGWRAPNSNPPVKPAKPSGFAAMTPERRRQLAAKGGRAAHEAGTAHEFTPAEARAAALKSLAKRWPRGMVDHGEAALASALEQRDALRRALEVIAVGDSKNPAWDAADELVALGFWSAEAVKQFRAAQAGEPAGTGEGASWEALRAACADLCRAVAGVLGEPDRNLIQRPERRARLRSSYNAALDALAGEPAVAAADEGRDTRKVTAPEDRWLRNAAKASGTLVAPGRLAASRDGNPISATREEEKEA